MAKRWFAEIVDRSAMSLALGLEHGFESVIIN